MEGQKTSSGKFITFEGGEGAGKSTQVRRLSRVLRAAGREGVETREPGGTDGAEEIRKIILNGPPTKWLPSSEALLMYAARADHVERVIKPALARGEFVICDRFSDSSMAYQGIAGGFGESALALLDRLALGGFGPDLTLVLDLPVEEGLKRAAARGGEGRFEQKGKAFHQRVRDAFLKIARENPERCAVIDASGDEDLVFSRVERAARERLPDLFP